MNLASSQCYVALVSGLISPSLREFWCWDELCSIISRGRCDAATEKPHFLSITTELWLVFHLGPKERVHSCVRVWRLALLGGSGTVARGSEGSRDTRSWHGQMEHRRGKKRLGEIGKDGSLTPRDGTTGLGRRIWQRWIFVLQLMILMGFRCGSGRRKKNKKTPKLKEPHQKSCSSWSYGTRAGLPVSILLKLYNLCLLSRLLQFNSV